MLSDKTWLLILVSVVFIIIICVYDLIVKHKSTTYSIGVGFIVGGAIGNLVDRIFLGGVRDFIFFEFYKTFPTFNVADSFLFVGTCIVIIYAIFIYKPKEKEKINGK